MLLRSETWGWLKYLNRVDDAELVQAVQARLLTDFDQTLEALKTQKVLSRSKNVATIHQHCAQMVIWAHNAPLQGSRRSRLIRHSQVTAFFQDGTAELKSRSNSLEIWHMSYTALCELVFTYLETLDRKIMKEAGSLLSDMRDPNQLHTIINSHGHALRQSFDLGVLIINEGRVRCQQESSLEIIQADALNEALVVAADTVRLMEIWDAYSFSDAQVKLTNDTLRLYRPNKVSLVANNIYERRQQSTDLTDKQSHRGTYRAVRQSVLENLSHFEPQLFEQFLSSDLVVDFLSKIEYAAGIHKQELSLNVAQFVDITRKVRIGNSRFTYAQIIEAWTVIFKLAEIALLWIELCEARSERLIPTVVSKGSLFSFFANHMKSSYASELFELFVARRAERGFQDLFYKPVLELEQDKFYISSTLIELSRFERNLLHIVARYVNESLSEKGRRPLKTVYKAFERAGFCAIVNMPIHSASNDIATDIDLAASKDGSAAIFQCKILSPSDSLYEFWKNTQALMRAAEQMDRTMAWLQEDSCAFFQRLNINREADMQAFLLTNIMTHSGLSIGGYPVLDTRHLLNILGGAVHRAFIVPSFQKIAQRRLTAAEYPSFAEFKQLSRKLREKDLKRTMLIDEAKLKIGTRSYVMPVENFNLNISNDANVLLA